MFNGCQHCHFAACRDFDDRLALVSEGRNREERAHEEELRILLKEWDSKLGEIGNQFDRNAALASGEARRGGLTEQASPGLRGDAPRQLESIAIQRVAAQHDGRLLPLVSSAITS